MNAFMFFAQADPDGNAVAGLFGGAIALIMFLWIIGIALTIFWVWMLIDAVANEPTTEQKILWFLVIFCLHFIGALVYVVVRKGSRTSAPPI